MPKKTSLIIIMLTLLALTILPNITQAEATTIQIEPPTSIVGLGTTFKVNLTITDVTDLAMWEVQLFYLNAILNCTKVTEGPFLKQGGSTFFARQIKNDYNATHGRLLFGSTLIGPVPGVDGSGMLATVTFQAKAYGTTPLHLTNTDFRDSTPPPRNPIPHTTTDGTVTVVTPAPCLWIWRHGAKVYPEWHVGSTTDAQVLYARITNEGNISVYVKVKFILVGAAKDVMDSSTALIEAGTIDLPARVTVSSAEYHPRFPGTYYVKAILYFSYDETTWYAWSDAQAQFGGEGVSKDIATRFKVT